MQHEINSALAPCRTGRQATGGRRCTPLQGTNCVILGADILIGTLAQGSMWRPPAALTPVQPEGDHEELVIARHRHRQVIADPLIQPCTATPAPGLNCSVSRCARVVRTVLVAETVGGGEIESRAPFEGGHALALLVGGGRCWRDSRLEVGVVAEWPAVDGADRAERI